MEHLSEELDKILHGTENFFISECKEGELAILNSNIRKMTIKMKEQASQLTHEKILLTDAIADIFHQLRTPLTSMRLTPEDDLLNPHSKQTPPPSKLQTKGRPTMLDEIERFDMKRKPQRMHLRWLIRSHEVMGPDAMIFVF